MNNEAKFKVGDVIINTKTLNDYYIFETGTKFIVDKYYSEPGRLSYYVLRALPSFRQAIPNKDFVEKNCLKIRDHLKFNVGDIISLEKWDLNIHTKDLKITAHLDFEDKVEIIDYNDDNYIVILSNKDYGIEFEINIKDCERCFKKVSDEDTEENKENKIEEITNECINTLSKCIEALQKIK